MTHAVVWIDHKEARELDGLDSILIVGPASAKFEFFKFVHANHHGLESKVSAATGAGGRAAA